MNVPIGNCHISKPLHGLKTVSDIYDIARNEFKPLEEINEITSHPLSIFSYNQIKSVITKKWGRLLKEKDYITLQNAPYIKRPNVVYFSKWNSQMLYLKMLDKIITPPTALQKWPLDERILKDLIEQNYKLLNNTKILDTQFRITNRFYHTKKQLFKWKIEAE